MLRKAPTTGRVSSQTDAKGNSSSNTYDARGRVTASIDRLGKTTSKAYDLEGRQLSITDAQSKQTTYVYNLLGQRTATTLPDGSARGMTYDAAGRLTLMDYPSGKSKTNVYTNGANDNCPEIPWLPSFDQLHLWMSPLVPPLVPIDSAIAGRVRASLVFSRLAIGIRVPTIQKITAKSDRNGTRIDRNSLFRLN